MVWNTQVGSKHLERLLDCILVTHAHTHAIDRWYRLLTVIKPEAAPDIISSFIVNFGLPLFLSLTSAYRYANNQRVCQQGGALTLM